MNHKETCDRRTGSVIEDRAGAKHANFAADWPAIKDLIDFLGVASQAQAPRPTQVKPPRQETGWLIEWSGKGYDSPQWLMGSFCDIPLSSGDAQFGLRFARKEDAETFAVMSPKLCVGAKVTEHLWVE